MHRVIINKKKHLGPFKAIAIGLLIASLLTFTLNRSKAQLFLGLKSGARMSWLSYEDFDSEQYKKSPFFGYSAGVTAAFKVQKRFSLQLDIMYSQAGKKIASANGPTLENNAQYHYLNTPVIYRLDFMESIGGRSFKWFLGVGPNVNFWLGGNGVLKSVELREDNIESLDYNIIFESLPANAKNEGLYFDEANRLQVGLIFSTGLVLEPNPGQALLIDFRYEWGHSYMATEEGRFTNVVGYTDNLKATNQAFQISVAYVFDVINKGEKEKKIYYKNK